MMIVSPLITDLILGSELNNDLNELNSYSFAERLTPEYSQREAEITNNLSI